MSSGAARIIGVETRIHRETYCRYEGGQGDGDGDEGEERKLRDQNTTKPKIDVTLIPSK